MGRQAFVTVALLLCAPLSTTVAFAQPVPQEETAEQARERIASTLKATKVTDVSPILRNFSEIGGRTVFEIDASGLPEPVTAAIRAAHSVVVWRSKRRPAPTEWLVNIKWDGMIIGPQLLFQGQWRAPIDSMTAEAWLAHQKYNGSPENGLIGLARWCRRGGAYQVPAFCNDVKAAAVDRMLWDRAIAR